MTDTGAQTTTVLHASCVDWAGRGLLILGAAGVGKSALALELLAFGCELVADDRTVIARRSGGLVASAPPAIAGRIEARFIGILEAQTTAETDLVLAVDLDHIEVSRLPLQLSVTYLDVALPLILRPQGGHLAAAVLQYLKAGRSA